MNTVTLIHDNTLATASSGNDARGKIPLDQLGDSPQQRFADVLPVAQAALEPASEKNATEATPPKKRRAGAQDAESKAVKKDSSPESRETTALRTDVANWSVVEAVQPAAQRRIKGSAVASLQSAKATANERAAEPLAVNGGGVERVATLHAASQQVFSVNSNQVQTQAIPQGSGQPTRPGKQAVPVQQAQSPQPAQPSSTGEQPKIVSVRANVASTISAPGRQETVRSALTVSKPALSAAQTTDGTPAARSEQAVQTMARSVVSGQAGVKNERVQVSTPMEAVIAVAHAKGQDASVPVKTASRNQPSQVAEKAGQATTKPQVGVTTSATGAESTAKSEKNPQGQKLDADVQPNSAPKRATKTSGENAKTESVESAGKDTPVIGPKEAGAATPELSVSSAGGSTAFSQPLVAQSQSPSPVGADVAVPRPPTQSVGEQILDSVQASAARGDRQVVVRLQPPELGSVLVRFQEQGEVLTGTLEVASREARREIEQALPQVLRSLQEAGVQIRRLEVVASDQPERDLAREHLPQEAWSQQQATGQGREHSHASHPMRWPQGTAEQSAVAREVRPDESRTTVAQGRIDLLM